MKPPGPLRRLICREPTGLDTHLAGDEYTYSPSIVADGMFHPDTERLIERVLQLRQEVAALHHQHKQAVAVQQRLVAVAERHLWDLARLHYATPAARNGVQDKRKQW